MIILFIYVLSNLISGDDELLICMIIINFASIFKRLPLTNSCTKTS